MSAITLAQAQTVLTEEQWLAQLLADLAAANVSTVGLSDFSAEMGLIRLQARALSAEGRIRANLAGTISLVNAALAGDDYLDAVALGRYDETRLPATKTLGSIRVTNSTGSTITVDARTQVADGGGPLFDNVDGWSIPATSFATKTFEARMAGVSGNVADFAIQKLRQGRAGLTVLNETGWIITAGRDKESNAAFILRCISKWGTQGRGGNLDAYNYMIPTFVPTITRWRIDDSNPGGPGTVWFWFASAAGPASGAEVAAEAAALGPKKPVGSGEFRYLSAPSVSLPIGCTLVTDGTNANAATQATAALVQLSSVFPLGPFTIQEELIKGVLMGGAFPAYGLTGFPGVVNLSGLTFTADQALATGEVLTITPTITQV